MRIFFLAAVLIFTVAGSGAWGNSGDDGPARQARLAGVAGISVVPEPGGKVTLFIGNDACENEAFTDSKLGHDRDYL